MMLGLKANFGIIIPASADFEARQFDLGTTSVRLLRVGSVIQLVFSNKLDARLYYAETASRFKRAEDELGKGRT